MTRHKIVLTIAGSDSGGGAGIQGDLKTFAALGCDGMSVITAITAQNTVGVRAVHVLPSEMVRLQIEAVLDDIGADAVKIGMLGGEDTIRTVTETLKRFKVSPIVLDPVMVSNSGDRLLDSSAVSALRSELAPLAAVITPNLPEAEALLDDMDLKGRDMEGTALRLLDLGPQAVLLKGGHFDGGECVDVLCQRGTRASVKLSAARIMSPNTHGTGCTLSSAIAAFLAHGLPIEAAASRAKEYICGAIREGAGFKLGRGHGPVHHFFSQWK